VKKDEKWVQRVLKSKNSSAGETLLLTVDSADRIFWQKKEQKE
jgi:hypothetical protein